MKRDLCNEGSYILKYKVTINSEGTKELVIYYADGTEIHRPYLKEEEKEVLENQKEQLTSVASKANEYKRNCNKAKTKTAILGGIAVMYAGILFSAFNIPTLIATGIFTYFTVRSAEKVLITNKQFKNIEKYKIFLKNENALNDVIEGKFALTEEYDRIDTRDNEIRPINSNTIDNIDYRSIKSTMRLSDVERKDWGDDETLSNLASQEFEYYKDKIKSKVKVLKR